MPTRTAPNHADLTEVDLERGAPSPDLDDFDTRTAHVEQQIDAVNRIVAHLPRNPAASLNAADETVSSIRKQLAFLADQNRQLVKSKSVGPATVRIRVTRFGKLARDFSASVTALEAARERHRAGVADALVDDVVSVDPRLERREVDEAVRQGNLETVLQRSDMRFQIEDLRARNRELERLTNSVNSLRELFVELGFLTENQQALINEIEHNVENVVEDVKEAEEQIVAAERYKRKLNKKKLILLLIILAIIAVIIIVVVIQVT